MDLGQINTHSKVYGYFNSPGGTSKSELIPTSRRTVVLNLRSRTKSPHLLNLESNFFPALDSPEPSPAACGVQTIEQPTQNAFGNPPGRRSRPGRTARPGGPGCHRGNKPRSASPPPCARTAAYISRASSVRQPPTLALAPSGPVRSWDAVARWAGKSPA